VEDNPQAAFRAYSEGVAAARRLLIEGLIGQTKTLLQLDRRREAQRCLLELLQLLAFEPSAGRSEGKDVAPDIIFASATGQIVAARLKGPFAAQIEELLNEVIATRSA
jgi:hypothetical protein